MTRQIVGFAAFLSGISLVGGCAESPSGNLNLVLTLPGEGDLRPSGMTTVAVGVMHGDGSESITTTPLDGSSFSAGEVTKGEPISLAVELRDNSNTLVGFGRLDDVLVPEVKKQEVTIPVRKPIVYVATGGTPHTIDPTRDALDPKYQGSMQALANATLVVPIDGTELAVISPTGLTRVATADHKVVGNLVDPRFGTINDAAAVPGQRTMVLATSMGIAIVDVDGNKAQQKPLSQGADRIAIGGSEAPGFTVYVLSGRVAAPTGTQTCSGTSQVLALALDGGTELPSTISTSVPLGDIAASGAAVFGANPCAGQVTRLDNGTPKVMMPLSGASVLAVEGNRLWGAGSQGGASTEGARIVLSSVKLDGSDVQTVRLPPKAEVMTFDGDTKGELSINMHADTEVALDLAILPGAHTAALITRMDTHRAARSDGIGVVIPTMDAIVQDVVLADTATGAVVQRIRARCDLDDHHPSTAEFELWSCIAITGAEAPTGGEMTPLAVGALYGGR